jgi:acetamidase/formamidase
MSFHIPALDTTVHWGYFSKKIAPILDVRSGDIVTIETLTHHAGDDFDRMIKGDPGIEAVYHWDAHTKRLPRHGAGPVEGPFQCGIGEGHGVHLLTGPVAVEGAEPGDVLEVRILDFLADLNYPFLETADDWVLQGLSFPNHLAALGPQAQTEIYNKSSLEAAMRDAFRKARRYLMKAHKLEEDEAISLISVAVDFGITQVVDGNWGVHAVIKKAIFPDYDGTLP